MDYGEPDVTRREQIRMTADEVRRFLDESRVATLASIGPSGRPHLMPLWYVRDGDELHCWTYRASQKARNLERLPQATVQVEAGEGYAELRGVMFECDVELTHEPARVRALGLALARRYAPGSSPQEEQGPEVVREIERQAEKRVAMRFIPTRTVTWDHRKL